MILRRWPKGALAALPRAFRDRIAGVPCVVADFPDTETLEAMQCGSPFDLLGLFEGVGRTEMDASLPTGTLPNRIWLYRRPILDYWAEHDDERLGDIVTHVLVHEIGHHFGLSDADMEAIEVAAGEE